MPPSRRSPSLTVLFATAGHDQEAVLARNASWQERGWLGSHTYGEIAPVGGRTMFHNYTRVLCALYARSRPHG